VSHSKWGGNGGWRVWIWGSGGRGDVGIVEMGRR
jgi:hypothetical protein